MSALTANRDTREREARVRRYPVLSGELMYAGGMAAILGSTGELEMASDKAGLAVMGRVEEFVDNSSDGLSCQVKTGCFLFGNSSSHPVASSSIGSFCYVEDDSTVSSSGGVNSIVAGVVFDVDSSGVWVSIESKAK